MQPKSSVKRRLQRTAQHRAGESATTMKIDLSQFRQTFMQESAEHVEAMEAGLLALRSAPDDTETLNAIFRSAHSIKGGAGSFGLTNLVRFTHALESLLDRLRAFEMPATAEVISLLLRSVDVLRAMLDPGSDGELPPGAAELAQQIASLSAAETAFDAKPPSSPASAVDDGEATGPLHFYRVSFVRTGKCFQAAPTPSCCCAILPRWAL